MSVGRMKRDAKVLAKCGQLEALWRGELGVFGKVPLRPLQCAKYLRLSGNSQAIEDPFDLAVWSTFSVVVADEQLVGE